jgi:hypothetical protein
MHLVNRLLLYLLLALGTARMVLYLDYAATMLPRPLESHNLEAKMVLLAYRAQHGLRLYPDWQVYPHVSNWFGPVASLAVGLAGRGAGSSIRGLFLIGRALSFGAGLLTALVLAVAIGRRHGRGAGLAAGVLSVGSGPMFGFTVMVRPDALAELLGTSGFFLVGGARRAARAAGLLLLVLAVLTKQPAGVFLLAAAIAVAATGDWQRGLRLLGIACAVLAAVVVAVNVLAEPHFASSLVGERIMPWSYAGWRRLLERMTAGCPELFVLPAIGLVFWLGDRAQPGAVASAVLVLLLLAASLGLSGKLGADMNYYLSLRVALALAAGTLWRAVHARARPLALAAALVVANVASIPSILLASGYVVLARHEAQVQKTPEGRAVLQAYREAFALAQNPRVRLLTDAGIIDVYQGERAAFGDPWLFRTLVELGLLQPRMIEEQIESQYYDLIVTTHDLESPRYLQEDFRLPAGLVARVRARYTRTTAPLGLFAYGRRPRAE